MKTIKALERISKKIYSPCEGCQKIRETGSYQACRKCEKLFERLIEIKRELGIYD